MDERLELTMAYDSEYVMQAFKRLPVAFVEGRGTRLIDTAGREYLDLVSGLGVTLLGHCHPRVTDAIRRQAETLLHTTNLYYVEPQARLAKLLVEDSFPGKVFFANSGAEANECALKIARKYHYALGRPRKKVVALLKSFHGRTIATLSATGQPGKWEPFAPVVEEFVHVAHDDPDALVDAVDGETAAVIIEPVLGEGGVYPVSVDVIEAAAGACRETGALLIFDEVQSGLGRTGELFAWMHSGVVPDVMTLAKGLANGVPVAAVIAGERCADTLVAGDHGSTFGGNFLACSAALETLEVIKEEGLPERAAVLGEKARDRLDELAGKARSVTGVRGRGLMLAVQLDSDSARDVVLGCLENGVVVNDVSPSAVRLLPALVIEEEELLDGIEVLEDVILEVGG